MDPALLKERELFKKRAIAQPVVENRKTKNPPKHNNAAPFKNKNKSKSNQKAPPPPPPPASFSKQNSSHQSQSKFAALAKIVQHLKQLHFDGDSHSLTFQEILDETNQLDLTSTVKQWLIIEALPLNPKILLSNGKYSFKPLFNIRNKNGLLKLLRNYDDQGRGGIYLDDVRESLPHADKCMALLDDQMYTVTRPVDKKVVLFYKDADYEFQVEPEFQQLWRSIPVDGLDEDKVSAYLKKQRIVGMQDNGVKRRVLAAPNKRKRSQKQNKKVKRHNDHLGDILEDYSEK
uniref:Transcription initiation factor IIE subunit beta n=1 Tax=Strigamia maritima TaxID=126957 RepID=T1JDR3_STRMM